MTIETLNAIKTETYNLNSGMITLSEKFMEYEQAGGIVPEHVDTAFSSMLNGLDVIRVWVTQAIENGTGEPEMTVMQNFLLELKAVFEKYNALIEVVSVDGYGVSYGEAGNGIKFTVHVDGVEESKTFSSPVAAIDL